SSGGGAWRPRPGSPRGSSREAYTHASRFFLYSGVRISRDHFLPPDPQAYLAAEPATGRVVVIAPTRAACETIELALGLNIEPIQAGNQGADIGRLAAAGGEGGGGGAAGGGFGIV